MISFNTPKQFWLFSLIFLSACGSGSSNTKVPQSNTSESPTPITQNNIEDNYNIIIYGNSHSSQLGRIIEHVIENQYPDKSVQTTTVSGPFLDNIVSIRANVDKLKNKNLSHAILQGQKYSQSGLTTYPTDAAEHLISSAKAQNITPILFPEHPQRGNPEEGQRVYDLHLSISAKQPSCVAPIGLVWNRLLVLMPNAKLHMDDGNHASYAGNVLTAMTFSEIITSRPADIMKYDPTINLSKQEQALFGQVVTEVLNLYPACGVS